MEEELIIITSKRIAKNTGALLIGIIINKLCTLIFFAFAVRHIGPEGFGKFTFALSFTAIFMILGDLGLNILAIREVAKDRALISKYLGNILVLRIIISSIVVGIIFVIITLWNHPPDTTKIVYIISISVFFITLSEALRWAFKAFQKMEYEALVNVAQGIILLGLGLAILYLDQGLIGLAFAHLSTSILIFCFSFLITVKKFATPKFKIDFKLCKFLIKISLPLGFMMILFAIYINIDTVLLSWLKGDTATGWYNAGYKLVLAIKFIPGVFALAILPVMSHFYKSSVESLEKVLRKSTQFMFLLALFIAILITILAYRIIPLIWGSGFSQSVISIQILIWGGAFAFFTPIATHTLIAINKQKIPAYIYLAGLLINVILNLILIPKFSYVGASISVLLSEFVMASFALFYIFQNLKFNPFPKQTLRILLVSLLTGILTWLIKDFNLILIIILVCTFYSGILLVSKGISDKDLKLMRQVLFLKELNHKRI